MQGKWNLVKVESKPENDKNPGDKFWFEEEQMQLAFGALQSARHRERFGSLTLKAGSKVVFEGTGKLIQTDKYPKGTGKAGLSKFQFRPAERMDSKAFGTLRGHLDVSLEAMFLHRVEQGEETGVEPEPFDDNVVPGSKAAHLKTDARKKTKTA